MRNIAKSCARYEEKILRIAKSWAILQNLAQVVWKFWKTKSCNLQNLAQYCKILRKIWRKKFNLQNHAQYCINLRKLCNLLQVLIEKKNLKTCKILRNIAESCASYVKVLKTKFCNLQNLAQYCKILRKIWKINSNSQNHAQSCINLHKLGESFEKKILRLAKSCVVLQNFAQDLWIKC